MDGFNRTTRTLALGVVALVALGSVVTGLGASDVAGAASPANWSTVPVPSGTGTLYGVTCPTSSECFAVGNGGFILKSIDGGTTWASQTTPVPVSLLQAITCPSASDCFAVGQFNDATGVILATTNGGTTWTSQVLPSGVVNIGLDNLSCSSDTECVAVLDYNDNGGPVLATDNGGSTWVNEPVPSGFYGLDDVSCAVGTTDCMAVSNGVLISTDGGASWSVGPDPAGGPLSSVWCGSTSTCVVFAGSDTTPTNAFTTSTFGSTWTSSTVPSGVPTVTGGTCSAATACVGVGAEGFPGETAILASADGGSSWSSQELPEGTAFLSNVSCPTTTVCIAVGQDTSGEGIIVSDSPAAMALTVTTSMLPPGTVYSHSDKAKYAASLSASGGNPPYKWTLATGSGQLPPGLKLSSRGVISGRASEAGTYRFTVEAVDTKMKSKGHPATQNAATAQLSITVDPAS